MPPKCSRSATTAYKVVAIVRPFHCSMEDKLSYYTGYIVHSNTVMIVRVSYRIICSGWETSSELQISPPLHPQKFCTTTCNATALILNLMFFFYSFHVVYVTNPNFVFKPHISQVSNCCGCKLRCC